METSKKVIDELSKILDATPKKLNQNDMTAVEWLIEQWPILESQIPERILNKAKEIEREQKHAEYMRGWKDGLTKQEKK